MIVIIAAIIGALGGGLRSKALGGKAMDIAHYAAVWAIIGVVLGVALTIIVERVLV